MKTVETGPNDEETQEQPQSLQVKTQIYFIRNSIGLINEHLTFQDEELALSLITIIDKFKNIENEYLATYSQVDLENRNIYCDISDISEAAFAVDERI